MSIHDIFEGTNIGSNIAPKVIQMTAHLLQGEMIPIGVFFAANERRDEPPTFFKATPIALFLKVSWITEPGILYVSGQIAAVGKAFEKITMGSRYSEDTFVNTSTVMPSPVEEVLLNKIEFTEFINEYFKAVRRAVAIPQDTALRFRQKLAGIFPEYPFGAMGKAAHHFNGTVTEEEMDALIKRHRES